MQLLAKFKTILDMGFRATLNFRKFFWLTSRVFPRSITFVYFSLLIIITVVHFLAPGIVKILNLEV